MLSSVPEARRRTGAVVGVVLALMLVGCSPSGGGAGPQRSGSAAQAGDGIEPAPQSGGRDLYMYYCAKCHGISALGDGVSVGSLRTQAGLNLTILGSRGDDEVSDTIAGGKGVEMPPWELKLSPDQRREIMQFVRTLAR